MPPADTTAEADLVREARRGGEQAFLAIYQRHRSPVFQFAWRLTGSQAAAEDITQECFLVLVRGAAFDSDRGALRTYLFGFALGDPQAPQHQIADLRARSRRSGERRRAYR